MKFSVSYTAAFENIIDLSPAQTGSFGLSLQVACDKCSHVSNKNVTSIADLEWEDIHAPPTNNFKCDSCKTTGKMKISKQSTATLTAEMNEASLIQVDSHGFTPCGCVFGSGWSARSVSGTLFREIDLSSGDFFDYDPVGQCVVSIRAATASIEVVYEGKQSQGRK